MFKLTSAALAVALTLAAPAAFIMAAPAALAHSGHDHGEAAAAAPPPIAEASGQGADGSTFQAVLAGGVLYLSDLATNDPVAGAAVEAEAGGWRATATATASPGVYRLEGAPDDADLTLMVSAGGRDDLILIPAPHAAAATPPAVEPRAGWMVWGPLAGAGTGIGGLGLLLMRRRRLAAAAVALALLLPGAARAHAGEDHGTPEPAAPAPVAGAAVTMPKATQFLLGVRTARVEPREAADSVRVIGRVVPDPAGFAKVQPSQAARVVADPAFPLPVPGQSVTRGQVVAVLEPTLTSVERSDTRSLLYRVESDIVLQERELARQEALANVTPAKTIETTRIRLAQLRREKAQIAGTALGRELVTAPVDGVITDVHVVPGEVVAPGGVLVEIVDPAKLRIEAVVHELAVASRISGATAATRLLPGEAFALELLGVSPRVNAQDQGVHAVFQVAADQAPRLKIGLPVDVYLATGATRMTTAVPREAVTDQTGKTVVFVRTAPERFEARPVTVRRTVGPLAEVEGVATGELVVIQGTAQLRAAR